MAAVRAANAGKTVLHDPAIKVFADVSGNDLFEISIFFLVPFRIDFFILFKMLVGNSIKIALFRHSPFIYSAMQKPRGRVSRIQESNLLSINILLKLLFLQN